MTKIPNIECYFGIEFLIFATFIPSRYLRYKVKLQFSGNAISALEEILAYFLFW